MSARTGEHIIFRDTRSRDQDDAFGDTHTRDHDDVRDTRTREHSDDRNAHSRDLQYRLNERPTHEDDRRNSGDIQHNFYHSGNNSSLSRPSSRNTVCVLSDHQPANHQEFELSLIGEITEEATVNTGNSKEHCEQDIISEFEDARTQRISSESDTVRFEGQNEHCAQVIISEFEDARTQKISSDSNTVVIETEIHANNTDAQHMVQLEEAQDFSDAGSLITQAPQSQAIHDQRYDQRAIDVGGCDPTTRIMVPRRVDR